jgi:hypothetical protein
MLFIIVLNNILINIKKSMNEFTNKEKNNFYMMMMMIKKENKKVFKLPIKNNSKLITKENLYLRKNIFKYV